MARISRFATAALVAGAMASAGCSFDQSGLGPEGSGSDAGGDGDETGVPDAEPVPTAFEKPIVIAGEQVSGELVDFPVYIELTDADLQARASASGEDIYFVDDLTAARLDHEIQRWDAEAGRLEAWVRVPRLEEDVDLQIWVRYGEPRAAPAPEPEAVWQAGFAAVWHLEQSPEGGADAIVDSVGGRHGTASASLDADRLGPASLGRGVRFEGGDDEITFANPLDGASAHTISAWVDQGSTNSNDALVVLGNGACGQSRWLHTRFTGGSVAAGFYCDDVTGGPNIQDDGPTLLHWTYDAGSESRMYRDGALVLGPIEHAGTQSTTGQVGHIGNAPGSFGQNMGLLALVDEVRISTVARAPEWIATEFANQSAPASFYSVGDERPVP